MQDPSSKGKSFEQSKAYNANQRRVCAIVQIPALNEETYGCGQSDMLNDRLTFSMKLWRWNRSPS